MHFTYIEDGIDAIVIDNFYTDKQLEDIRTELNWLTKKPIMQDETKLSAATVDGVIQTSKRGVFLEEVFVNWKHSALISNLMYNMDTPQFREKLLSYNTLYKTLFSCNTRSHLLSYYENADYYHPHTDSAFYTVLNYFVKEPKQFSGGEIILKSCNSTKEANVEVMDNRVVIIASCTVHEVKPIVSSMQNTLSGNGRYCNSAFISISDQRKEDRK
jgi:Rps23 Pro-64 3,4-dihydroxylase Tpa1-like proline 4-hydroxylase